MKKIPLIAIVGPTAVGKTALSIELAKEFNCEIISIDSVQIYKKFDIGSAKVKKEEMIKIIVEKVLKNNNITFNELRNDAIAMASCKMSIKANQILNEVEMNKVISDLYECKNPFTCPHGRPIITKMEKKDLEKMFKRIV